MGQFYDFFMASIRYLEDHPEQSLVFYLGDYERFQCSRCAQCCILPWRVDVDQAYVEIWEARINGQEDARFHTPFERMLPQARGPYMGRDVYAYIRKKTDDSCVFLDDDKLCWLHKTYGEAAKPLVCQNYPRVQNQLTPGLFNYHLKSSCQEAARLLLKPEHIETHYRLRPEPTPEPLRFSEDLILSEPVLLRWQGIVLDLLNRNDLDPIQAFSLLLAPLAELLNTSEIGPQMLEQLNQTQARQTLPQLEKGAFLDWLKPDWNPLTQAMFSRFRRQYEKSDRLLPQLSPAEKEGLDLGVRHYLMRQCLALPTLFISGHHLLHCYFGMVYVLMMCQWIIAARLFYKLDSFNPELFRYALNLPESVLLQSKDWQQKVQKLTSEECLQGMRACLSLNLFTPLEHPAF